MRKIIKKIITISSALIMASLPIFAEPEYRYIEKKETTTISEGVSLDKIMDFSSNGVRNINVVRFNISNDKVELIPIYNNNTASQGMAVTKMVDGFGAVAGINGDFFNYNPRAPLGMAISNGEMIYSNSDSSDPTPSIIMNKSTNSMDVGRFDINMKLVFTGAQGVKEIPLGLINKPNGYGSTGMYTRAWGNSSRGGKTNSQTEVAVSGGVVIDRKDQDTPMAIPEGGYVVNIKDGLYLPSVGDKVELQITGVNINDISFAIGAGSVILKDGVVQNAGINIAGNHPRTAMGFNKNTGEIYLVTVDGRSIYHGMDTTELAELLKRLGATEAVNLDGGGSTTLAIRDVNTGKAKVENHISSERAVMNGVGVKSKSSVGAPAKMEIKTEGDKLFKNTTKWVSIKLFDAVGNPIAVDNSKIVLQSSLPAEINKNSFKPTSSGKLELTVSYGDLSQAISFEVLDTPQVLLLEDDTIGLQSGGSYKLKDAIGIDIVGNRATIRAHELKAEVVGNVGVIKDGVFKRNEVKENGAIALSFGSAKARIIVSKSAYKEGINPMGEITGLKAYALPAPGRASLQVVQDKRPVTRLWYNFSATKAAKSFGINFTGVVLPKDSSELSIFTKNHEDFVPQATITVAGKDMVVSFSENLELLGYTEWRAKLPGENNIALKNIFFAAPEGTASKGHIDIKDLSAVISPDTSTMYANLRTNYNDELLTNNLRSTDIAIVAVGDKAKADLANDVLKNHNIVISIDGKAQSNNKDMIKTDGSSIFAQFKNDKGGLRASDTKQWNELLTTVKNSKAGNVFITLDGGSKDELGIINPVERELFRETVEDMMKSGKRVFVITNLKEPSGTRYDEGVRYINLNPDDSSSEYLNINRIGENVIYSINKIN
ncbi:MAG: phosphodiester glycosidase family protein [Ezakiella sp.]|nr:phosphodiester glycosidase family protein [Ezakiella sp.]